MQHRQNQVEILECLLIVLLIGPLLKGINAALAPLVSRLVPKMPGSGALNLLLVGEIIQCAVIFAVVWLFWRVGHKRPWQALGLKKSGQSHWLLRALGHGAALFVVMLGLSMLLSALLPTGLPPQNVAALIDRAQTPWEKAVPILAAGILAPISEEVLFRGFFYQSLRTKFGTGMSILLAAMLFGCMHFDPYRLLPLMLGGIWLNILYVRSDSLYSPMVAHSVWNILMTAAMYWA